MKNTTQNKKFYLHVRIIESPSIDDFLAKRYEGELLHKFLTWRGIKSHHYFAIDKNSFRQAISYLVKEIFGEGFKIVGLSKLHNEPIPTLLPIIHISAHGSSKGISLTNRELVSWKELGDWLSLVNKVFKGIILSISACKGWDVLKVLVESESLLFFALIANKEKPTWGDTQLGLLLYIIDLRMNWIFRRQLMRLRKRQVIRILIT